MQTFVVNLVLAESRVAKAQFATTFNEESALVVDEHTTNQVAKVLVPIVLERIGEEVVHVDYSRICNQRTVNIVAVLPNFVVTRELENVGVHIEYQQVASNLYFGLEQTAVAVFELYSVVGILQDSIVFDYNVVQYLFQYRKRLLGIVVNHLFQLRLLKHGLYYSVAYFCISFHCYVFSF